MTTLDPAPTVDAPVGARRVADLTAVDLTRSGSFRAAVPHGAFGAITEAGGIAWHDEGPVDPSLGNDVVRFVDSPGFWAVTSHALVGEVLRDQARFSSELGTTVLHTLAPESLGMLRAMMLNMDSPGHTRLRRILQPSFTPRSIRLIHDDVEVNAAEIIAELGDADRCELVRSVSAEMPLRVLADLFGMPREDRHLIFQWSNAMLDADSAEAAEQVEAGVDAIGAAMAYGTAMAADRRAQPRDDIVSLIANAEIDGDRLDELEFAMFWVMLVVAGNETTRNALSGSVIALVEHDLWGWLGANREAVPGAVDELLRYVSPVQHFRRTATQDTVLGDQRVRAGDKVVVWYGAANRDPAVFADPHHLDLQRDPNPHLAFGIGPHFCLGSHLAKLELISMLTALLDRAPNLQLDGEPERVASNFINGIRSLPVRLG